MTRPLRPSLDLARAELDIELARQCLDLKRGDLQRVDRSESWLLGRATMTFLGAAPITVYGMTDEVAP